MEQKSTNHDHLREVSDKDKATLRELSELYKSVGWGSPEYEEWDRLTHPYNIDLLLDELAALRKENEGLRSKVESAYREGFDDGYADAVQDERGRGGDGVDESWKHSNAARAAIGDSHE